MRYIYCPQCGRKLTEIHAGDDGMAPYCDSCKKRWFDTFQSCVLVLTYEETAVREVKEELGLDIEKLSYAGTMWFGEKDMLMHDALFHRFRLTFDLAWKLLKAILDYEGVEAASPRSAIREAWKLHLITDAEKWLDMQEKRNLTAHTYNESTAREIYRLVKEEYYSLLEELDQRME